MLPNIRLMARAFHRIPVSTSPAPVVTITSSSSSTSTSSGSPLRRRLSTSALAQKWEGRQPEEHAVNEHDAGNVQHDAAKEGQRERAKGGDGAGEGAGSVATSQKAGDVHEKTKKEFPEARDTIGMQDERGGKA